MVVAPHRHHHLWVVETALTPECLRPLRYIDASLPTPSASCGLCIVTSEFWNETLPPLHHRDHGRISAPFWSSTTGVVPTPEQPTSLPQAHSHIHIHIRELAIPSSQLLRRKSLRHRECHTPGHAGVDLDRHRRLAREGIVPSHLPKSPDQAGVAGHEGFATSATGASFAGFLSTCILNCKHSRHHHKQTNTLSSPSPKLWKLTADSIAATTASANAFRSLLPPTSFVRRLALGHTPLRYRPAPARRCRLVQVM